MDPVTIGLLAGVGLGLLRGNRNAKKNEEQDRYRKAAMLYSPWTGMGDVGGGNAPGVLDSALQGAALGSSVGSMLKPSSTIAQSSTTDKLGSSQELYTPLEIYKKETSPSFEGPPQESTFELMNSPENLKALEDEAKSKKWEKYFGKSDFKNSPIYNAWSYMMGNK